MSQENIEIVREIYGLTMADGQMHGWVDPATDDDCERARRLEELVEPRVELRQMAEIVDTGGSFVGYEGLRCAPRELLAVFEDFRIVPERYVDAGDIVVTEVCGQGHGRGSGVTVEMRVGHVWELHVGRVVRWTVYPTPADALSAAGLTE